MGDPMQKDEGDSSASQPWHLRSEWQQMHGRHFFPPFPTKTKAAEGIKAFRCFV